MMGRLARCLACGAKLKIEEQPGSLATPACPMCGLTLVGPASLSDLAPVAVPRATLEACWASLAKERRLPLQGGATELREARLLLVPFWKRDDPTGGGGSGAGLVVSGADLLPIGLPPLTARRQNVRGLGVRTGTRTGDAMGRLPGGASLDAIAVDATLGPDALTPQEAIEAGRAGSGAPAWRLVYYPVWAMCYVLFNKEHHHVVDAVTGRPVGPARRVRWSIVSALWAAAMLALFLSGLPWLGWLAALPAWAVSVAVMKGASRWQRG